VTRTTTTRLDAEQLPNSNIRKRFFEAKVGPGKKSLAFDFLFEEINTLKRQLKAEKIASSKKSAKEG
jgi:hypothetical protein